MCVCMHVHRHTHTWSNDQTHILLNFWAHNIRKEKLFQSSSKNVQGDPKALLLPLCMRYSEFSNIVRM